MKRWESKEVSAESLLFCSLMATNDLHKQRKFFWLDIARYRVDAFCLKQFAENSIVKQVSQCRRSFLEPSMYTPDTTACSHLPSSRQLDKVIGSIYAGLFYIHIRRLVAIFFL